jgi:hypothetical protein
MVSRVRTFAPRPVALAALVVIAVVGALGLPATAPAHVPTVEGAQGFEDGADGDGETRIGGPEKSRAIYGYLAGGVDRYAFTTTQPIERTIGVIVPAYDEHASFYPTLILEEDGVEVARADDPAGDERTGEFEPFSLTTFWEGAEIEYGFEPGHDYVVRIEPGPTGDSSGRYVLVVGGPEAFTGSDIAETFRGLPRIWFGAYGGAPFRFNPLGLIPFALVAGVLGLLGYKIVRRVKRRSSIAR